MKDETWSMISPPLEEKSWRRNQCDSWSTGGGIREEESGRRNHEGGIIIMHMDQEEVQESWKRHHPGGTRRHPGGTQEAPWSQEAPGGTLRAWSSGPRTLEAPRKHLVPGPQDLSPGPGTPRRHPPGAIIATPLS